MSTTAWRDELYDSTFTAALASLEASMRRNKRALEEAKGILRHLYVKEGNDQGGRGEREDTILRAEISAYEAFVHAAKGGDEGGTY
jgi:hypothetical protein